jgi:hypothetical protein
MSLSLVSTNGFNPDFHAPNRCGLAQFPGIPLHNHHCKASEFLNPRIPRNLALFSAYLRELWVSALDFSVSPTSWAERAC